MAVSKKAIKTFLNRTMTPNNSQFKGIYFDNAASAPVLPEVIEYFNSVCLTSFANQEALNGAAYALRKNLEEAEKELIRLLCGNCRDDVKVIWTDSGTSAINAALMHPFFSGVEIITTEAEHPATSAALKRASDHIRTVKLKDGLIDLEHLAEILNESVKLVAIHHVQSETGAVQDLSAVGKIIKEKAPGAIFMVDTVQSAGKLSLPWNDSGIDFAFASGHKVGAPGGGAAIYRDQVFNREKLSVVYQALRKEDHLLSRPTPMLALTLTEAIRLRCSCMKENLEKVITLNNYLRNWLESEFDGKVKITFSSDNASPYILHFLLPGYQGAVLVRMLSGAGIYVASGSACAAETGTPSRALLATGVPKQDVYAGMRVSFMPSNTIDEIDTFCNDLKNCLKNY